MNGLENITKAIIDQAQNQADEIIANAKNQADRLGEKYKAEAEAQNDEIVALAEKKAKSIANAADSYCELDEKNQLLKAKMALINDMFDKAIERLCSLSTEDYFVALNKLICANALNENGELVLNSNDLKRMPSGFMSMVQSSIGGKSLELCGEPNDSIIGGCILKYGDISMNLSFDKIINSEREMLTDKINKVLFE